MSDGPSPYLFLLLPDHSVVHAPDAQMWAVWMATADRKVGLDSGPGWQVSTVFMGIDPYAAIAQATPRPFESLIYVDGDVPGLADLAVLDATCRRYASWQEAATGHATLVAQLRTAAQIH